MQTFTHHRARTSHVEQSPERIWPGSSVPEDCWYWPASLHTAHTPLWRPARCESRLRRNTCGQSRSWYSATQAVKTRRPSLKKSREWEWELSPSFSVFLLQIQTGLAIVGRQAALYSWRWESFLKTDVSDLTNRVIPDRKLNFLIMNNECKNNTVDIRLFHLF